MNATYRMLLFGALPLGALAGGLLGSAFGLRARHGDLGCSRWPPRSCGSSSRRCSGSPRCRRGRYPPCPTARPMTGMERADAQTATDAPGRRARARSRRPPTCRCATRRSSCGSSTGSTTGCPRTTSRTCCGCPGRWTTPRWAGRWTPWSPGTSRCAPGWWPGRTAGRCRSSTRRRPAARTRPGRPAALDAEAAAGRAARALAAEAAAPVPAGRGAAAAGPAGRGWPAEPSTSLIVVAHQRCSTTASIGVLVRDLAALYQAEVTGEPPACRAAGAVRRLRAAGSARRLTGPAWPAGGLLARRAGTASRTSSSPPTGRGRCWPAIDGAVEHRPTRPRAAGRPARAEPPRRAPRCSSRCWPALQALLHRYTGQPTWSSARWRGPGPGRAGRADRLPGRHAADPRRPVRRPGVHRAAGAGCRTPRRAPAAPGPAVRQARRDAAAWSATPAGPRCSRSRCSYAEPRRRTSRRPASTLPRRA